ncbi:cytochrome c biogenesis protein DipZ [Pseudomonas sp. PDM16]|uniref:cytochrome c biogenesis protein DipZ n=1 Tax=Pseudomonas sp. PDM16 TaxID=2769292 RepID=UPI00178340E4|nr:cytochrome c biogenesis protein DipZ [Pseudomonas sp. PDM16]MBD9416122.1 cytochrome c biogenesis protein DipZ [Pseudomonas sp. PDM16]
MLIVAFFGGALTLLSPCILPIVPFLLVRSGQRLPTFVGLAVTFALVSSLAVASTEWVVQASQFARHLALAGLAAFSLALASPRLAEWVMGPFSRLGGYLDTVGRHRAGSLGGVLLGVATGLLWAPCAGPILGLILAGAMLGGGSADSSLLLLAYGSGAAGALGVIALAGDRLMARLRRSLSLSILLRRTAGVVMLGAVLVMSSGLDRQLLARFQPITTDVIERGLIERAPTLSLDHLLPHVEAVPLKDPAVSPAMPELRRAVQWLNSAPLNRGALRGKVLLIDFWTYGCINCQRTLPKVQDWARRYRDQGLVVIGVHTPEYAFEKVISGVREEVERLGIEYPVAIDNDYRIWNAFSNSYWPAHYFVDAEGRIRYLHIGEGGYAEQERVIVALLAEARRSAEPVVTPR